MGDNLRSRIPEGSMVLDNFRINKIFTSAEKNSASQSVIALATYTGPLATEYHRDVVFKISLSYTDRQVHHILEERDFTERGSTSEDVQRLLALEYESCVYSNVFRLPDQTNFVQYVETFLLNEDSEEYSAILALDKDLNTVDIFKSILRTKFGSPHGDVLADEISSIADSLNEKYEVMPSVMNITITEKEPNVGSLSDFLKAAMNKNKLTERTLKSIIVQILANLEMLHRAGVRHNDLHLGNVLISLGPNRTKTYNLGTRQVEANLSAKVLFFDWDLSYAPAWCSENRALPGWLCDDFGMCNATGSDKYDAFFFLYALMEFFDKDKYKANRIVQDFLAFYNRIEDLLAVDDFSSSCENSKCGRLKSNVDNIPDFPTAFNLNDIYQSRYLTFDAEERAPVVLPRKRRTPQRTQQILQQQQSDRRRSRRLRALPERRF